MFWAVIIAVWLVCLAVFLELVRRAPLMEETEHGLVYVDRSPSPTQPSTKAARLRLLIASLLAEAIKARRHSHYGAYSPAAPPSASRSPASA